MKRPWTWVHCKSSNISLQDSSFHCSLGVLHRSQQHACLALEKLNSVNKPTSKVGRKLAQNVPSTCVWFLVSLENCNFLWELLNSLCLSSCKWMRSIGKLSNFWSKILSSLSNSFESWEIHKIIFTHFILICRCFTYLASHSSTDLLTLIWSSMINTNSVNDTCCCVQLFQTCWMTKPWTTAQLLPQSIGHSRTRIKAIQPPTPTTQSPMALMAPISLSQYHQLRLTWLLTLLVTDGLNW